MITKAAVVGAGLMGSAISRHMASHGMSVLLLDTNEDQLARAREASGALDINCSSDFELLGDVQYVIEAVFEDLTVKKEV